MTVLAMRPRVLATRARLADGLARLGFAVTPSRANFVWARREEGSGERLPDTSIAQVHELQMLDTSGRRQRWRREHCPSQELHDWRYSQRGAITTIRVIDHSN